MDKLSEHPQGWPSGDELDERIEVLGLAAEAHTTEPDRKLALWVRGIAGAAARELLLANRGRER
jgi:hypothetical protein